MKSMTKNRIAVAVMAAWMGCAAVPAQAQDFDLTDMVPARPGQAVEPQGDVVVEDGIVIAADEATAVSVAHQQLIDNTQDGVMTIAVGSGVGLLSTGSASYQTYDNINATLLSKRAAYNQAFLAAKKGLVEYQKGAEVVCSNLVSMQMDYIDSGTDSMGNTSTSSKEGCADSVAGSLAGYVTYDVFDDTDKKSVRISVISTPKTREQIQANTGAVSVVSDPNEVFKQVVSDIQKGVMPPLGAKVLTNANTGEVVLMGFGSAIIRQNNNARIASRLADAAMRQSQTRARAALLGTMQGEEIYWRGSFDESQVESTEQFEYEDPVLQDPSEVEKLDQERTVFLNQFKETQDYGSLTKGQLPPGVGLRSFVSEDGYWQYTVAVYAPSLSAAAKEAARDQQARGKDARDARGGVNNKGANPRGASGKVSKEDDL